MDHAISNDGTRIAYDARGRGDALILVDGAFCHRGFGPMPQLAPLLEQRFRVITYDRRGRGDSGDTPPHALEREVEDIQALMEVAGGSASVFGISSGALLAMRAAASGLPVTRLAIYEPPLVLADAPGKVQPDRKAEIIGHVEAGRRSEAVTAFMQMVGVPGLMIPIMRLMPGVWSKLTRVAHTLPYDFALLGDTGEGKPMPEELKAVMESLTIPMWVGLGGKSPPYMRHAAETITKSVKGAELSVLDGQTHNVSAKALAPALTTFFQGD